MSSASSSLGSGPQPAAGNNGPIQAPGNSLLVLPAPPTATSVSNGVIVSSGSALVLANWGTPLHFTIDPNGDATIILYKLSDIATYIDPCGRRIRGRQVADFRVSRTAIINGMKESQGPLAQLAAYSNKEYFNVRGTDFSSFYLWCRVLHSHTDIEDSYKKDFKDAWDILVMSHRYFLKAELMKSWFAEWLDRKGGITAMDKQYFTSLMAVLMCWEFDHPLGFHYGTREAAYLKAGHIKFTILRGFQKTRLALPPLIVGRTKISRSSGNYC